MEKEELEKFKDFLNKNQYNAEGEISILNRLVDRDDVPTWKISEYRERKDYLESRVAVLKEIKAEVERIFG